MHLFSTELMPGINDSFEERSGCQSPNLNDIVYKFNRKADT